MSQKLISNTLLKNVLCKCAQIFDNLLRSFGEDVLHVLFNSIEGLATGSPESINFDLLRYILDQIIAIIVFNILPNFYFHLN